MEVFEVVVALLLGGAALAAVARRVGAPYPALAALAGAALALVPGVPTLVLDPELALFVAPVLVDAAFDASPRDLRSNWRPVASLALGAVAPTIVVVAVVARLLVPDLPWAAEGTIGDAAFQRLEAELDWAELGWAQVIAPEHRVDRKGLASGRPAGHGRTSIALSLDRVEPGRRESGDLANLHKGCPRCATSTKLSPNESCPLH